MRGDHRVCHDDSAWLRQERRKEPAGGREKARPDVDRIAALAERDMQRPDLAHGGADSWSDASSSRAKRAISSRLDSTTDAATSR